MPKLIMLRGLPGSGKSTWAKRMIAEHQHFIRVNKDEIRTELGLDGTWSPAQEPKVVEVRDNRIEYALSRGISVISDDTNFGKKHEPRLRELAKKYNAEFEIKEFNTPVETCILRDSERSGKARVGEDVIWGMAEQHLGLKRPAKLEPYVPDPSLPRVILCDLDGTAALHNGRGPFDYHKIHTDLPNKPIKDILWAMANQGVETIYMSGREDTDNVRADTIKWLQDNNFPPYAYHKLFMRAKGDYRKDSVVKYELFNNHIRKLYYVQFVLDDRDQVVKMWRELGLTCLQVNYGDF